MPPRARKAPPAPPAPAAPPAPERDYLVIFEEPDPYGLPADDTLVLDIEQPQAPARPEVDVQQKVALELSNTTSRLGTAGFITCVAGCLLGVALMVAFAVIYPDQWYGNDTVNRTMILLSALAVVAMICGTILTHYGRRIRAHGRLSDVRIVEKLPESRASLE